MSDCNFLLITLRLRCISTTSPLTAGAPHACYPRDLDTRRHTRIYPERGLLPMGRDGYPMGESRSRAGTVHPRHLGQSALSTFLTEKLGLPEFAPGALARTLSTKYFLLPTSAGKPAPCFELLRYVDEEEPIEFDLAPWQVSCYQVTDIIATLNDIHFIALHAAEDFQLGADLLFWYQYSQAIKGIIAKDQFFPAQKYQEIVSPPINRGGTARE